MTLFTSTFPLMVLVCLPALAQSLSCLVGQATSVTVAGMTTNTGALNATECSSSEDACFRIDGAYTTQGIPFTTTIGQCQVFAACPFITCDLITALLPSGVTPSTCTLGCCQTNNCNNVTLSSGGSTGGSTTGGAESITFNKIMIPLLMLASVIAIY